MSAAGGWPLPAAWHATARIRSRRRALATVGCPQSSKTDEQMAFRRGLNP